MVQKGVGIKQQIKGKEQVVIPIIGIMMGSYCAARCVEMVSDGDNSGIRLMAIIALIVNVAGILMLLSSGTDPALTSLVKP